MNHLEDSRNDPYLNELLIKMMNSAKDYLQKRTEDWSTNQVPE